MRNFSRSTIIILFAIVFQLLGCSKDTDNDTVEDTDTSPVESLIAEPNFTNTDVFLKWTDGDFFLPQP